MEHDTQNEPRGLWSETKYPDRTDQIPPAELRFHDPLDKIESQSPSDEKQKKNAVISAALGICSAVTFPLKQIPLVLGAAAVLFGWYCYSRHAESRKISRIGIIAGIIGIAAALLNIFLFPVLFDLLKGFAGGMVPEDLS